MTCIFIYFPFKKKMYILITKNVNLNYKNLVEINDVLMDKIFEYYSFIMSNDNNFSKKNILI